jgi:hypothetical protein
MHNPWQHVAWDDVKRLSSSRANASGPSQSGRHGVGRPLRPEARYRRGLPAPQHAWPGTDRPRMSADVHCWPWRLSLTSSLSRACADGCWPDGNRDGNDDGQVDRCTGAQGQHESALLSRQPRVCKASVLWIGLWMLSANRLVNCCEAVDEQGCGKVDNREDASLALGREASAVHKRNEISTVQPVSSVIPATGMLADLPFFRCSGCPGQTRCTRVRGCARMPQGADGCRRCRHGCRRRFQRLFRLNSGESDQGRRHRRGLSLAACMPGLRMTGRMMAVSGSPPAKSDG